MKLLWGSYKVEESEKKITIQNPSIEVLLNSNPIEAVNKALELAKNKENTLVLVTGSLYLIGNVRKYWYPIEELL